MLLSFSSKRCYMGELRIQFLNNIRQSCSGELTYKYPNPMLTLAAGDFLREVQNRNTRQLYSSPSLSLSNTMARHTSTKPATAVKVEWKDYKRGDSHSDSQGLVNIAYILTMPCSWS
jgi:hypothetical protein